MQIRLLIDGYNLLFTSGMEGRGRGPKWLQRARERLLKFLRSKLPAADVPATLVVFDAATRPFGASVENSGVRDQPSSGADLPVADGIQVIYAVNYDEADDLIENIIRKHSAPKSLTVVSSDNRIRKCALARRARSLDVEAFLTQLEASTVDEGPSPIPGENVPGENADILTQEEVESWLREFGEAGES